MLLTVLIVVLPLCFVVGMILCDKLEEAYGQDEEDAKTLTGALD